MTRSLAIPEPQTPATFLTSNFAGADDLLGAGQTGALARAGPVSVVRTGRIGPLIEIVVARRAAPDAYAQVTIEAPFAATIDHALDHRQASGLDKGNRSGVFPLIELGSEGEQIDVWRHWLSRADQAAKAAGFPDRTAAELIGALGELEDNVFRHSQAYETGLAAYAASALGFEMVVCDGGCGVLASLRSNPGYADLQDAGEALRVAVADGQSRLGRDSGAGYGMGQMFRALANHDGDLRFRSDDHALEVRGHSLQGELKLTHVAPLPGLTISALCRPSPRASGTV